MRTPWSCPATPARPPGANALAVATARPAATTLIAKPVKVNVPIAAQATRLPVKILTIAAAMAVKIAIVVLLSLFYFYSETTAKYAAKNKISPIANPPKKTCHVIDPKIYFAAIGVREKIAFNEGIAIIILFS
jgi:hypothetical protein